MGVRLHCRGLIPNTAARFILNLPWNENYAGIPSRSGSQWSRLVSNIFTMQPTANDKSRSDGSDERTVASVLLVSRWQTDTTRTVNIKHVRWREGIPSTSNDEKQRFGCQLAEPTRSLVLVLMELWMLSLDFTLPTVHHQSRWHGQWMCAVVDTSNWIACTFGWETGNLAKW